MYRTEDELLQEIEDLKKENKRLQEIINNALKAAEGKSATSSEEKVWPKERNCPCDPEGKFWNTPGASCLGHRNDCPN